MQEPTAIVDSHNMESILWGPAEPARQFNQLVNSRRPDAPCNALITAALNRC